LLYIIIIKTDLCKQFEIEKKSKANTPSSAFGEILIPNPQPLSPHPDKSGGTMPAGMLTLPSGELPSFMRLVESWTFHLFP
jgi:hypothetical protein